MTELRLAARLARREVRRRPGRTALVGVLVAVPVAFMTLSIVLLRTEDVSQEEAWQRDYGDADALVEGVAPPDLPRGARSVAVDSTLLRVGTAGGERAGADVLALPAGDPLMDGLADVVAGRFPRAADEVALAPELAADLGVGVGDRLALDRPTRLALDVVGLAEKPGDLGRPLALTAPGSRLLDADPRHPPVRTYYIDLPDGVALDGLRGATRVLVRGAFIEDAEGMSDLLVLWIYVLGAVFLTVVGIVIAAAFAAGARRQLVVLGQLSANGAPGRLLRSTLVLQGTLTGLLGAVAGVALVLGLLTASRSWFQRGLSYRFEHYDIRPVDLVGAVLVGVIAASLAALIPAWSVARVSTLAALAGRRPLKPVRPQVTRAGAVAFVAGLGLMGLAVLGAQSGEHAGTWAFVLVLGGVMELLGACALAPAVVARLEGLAGHTRGAWRLAARGLARERARTGAVVSAVAAAGGLAVMSTAVVAGMAAGEAARPSLAPGLVVVGELAPTYEPPDAAFTAQLARLFPDATRLTVRLAGRASDWLGASVPVVADGPVLDGFGLEGEVRRALARDGLVALGPGSDLGTTITLPGGETDPLTEVRSRRDLGVLPNLLITPARAADLGVEPSPTAVAFVNDAPIKRAQMRALESFRDDWQFDDPNVDRWVSVDRPDDGPPAARIELILASIALAFAVLVVGASLALAATESRDERDVLTVAGVAPRTLARSAGGKAWLLASLGAAMAIPVGVLPVAVFVAADDGQLQFRVPWRTIALLALALPAIAAAVAHTASTLAQRLSPVRVSNAVFE